MLTVASGEMVSDAGLSLERQSNSAGQLRANRPRSEKKRIPSGMVTSQAETKAEKIKDRFSSPPSASSQSEVWYQHQRSAMIAGSSLYELPVAATVEERIEQSPYVQTDVFRRSAKQILKPTQIKQPPMEFELDSRSKTMLSQSFAPGERPRKLSSLNINLERLQQAKESAERAIKAKKVFTIQGPYSHVREALRKRGWIEKFYKIDTPTANTKKSPRNKKAKHNASGNVVSDDSDNGDDDDGDVDDDDIDDDDKEEENAEKPWEEENGVYGIMSRLARNCAPQFIWCIRRDAIDFRYLRKEQMVNHYGQNGAFTTKVGLCTNLRNAHWFEDASHETFFPRCYRLSHEEEKGSFIDDFYLTACMSIVRWVIMRHREGLDMDVPSDDEAEYLPPPPVDRPVADSPRDVSRGQQDESGEASMANTSLKMTSGVDTPDQQSTEVANEAQKDTGITREDTSVKPLALPPLENKQENKSPRKDVDTKHDSAVTPLEGLPFIYNIKVDEYDECQGQSGCSDYSEAKKKTIKLPMSLLETALNQCEQFIRFKENEDLENMQEQELLKIDWVTFITQYYQLCHNKGVIPGTRSRLDECERTANEMRQYCPQFDMDGVKNMWIVKPGAKSRGRGIVCYDKLHEMLKLVDSVVRKDSKFVVQKYIERPLLIYNTKFDIRQWFLVTDWNPLTIWWYNDFYCRFCKKVFTLDELDEVIHLSNNAIQKNYSVDPARSKEIPADSMWASDDEFQDFLDKRGVGHLMEERIKPGMQKAVICSLLTTRDIIEYRKSSFELYGADFMLTEDYTPWLLEINCSPTLARNTHVTKRLCHNVVEDTMKVVIDRKYDKNCDTGRFELIYKTTTVAVPQYLGINLSVEGTTIKTPGSSNYVPKPRRSTESTYSNVMPRIDNSAPPAIPTAAKEKKEKKKKHQHSVRLSHRDRDMLDTVKGKKTPPESEDKTTPTLETIDEKATSEPSSAKYTRGGDNQVLLARRKRNASKSVEVPKTQFDVMKPTDSYLRKIREGITNAQKLLKVEPGTTEKSFCPKCGGNGIIKLANENDSCSCRQDCIQTDPIVNTDLLPYQVRNANGLLSNSGNLNMTSRSRVLKVLQREQNSQLIVPFAPRKLVIKPPDHLPLVTGSMQRFLNITPGPDTLPYRKPKKQSPASYRLQKGMADQQTMYVLAESFTHRHLE